MTMLTVVLTSGCTQPPEKINGQEVYDPSDEELADGPVFKQSKFQIYVLYRPQVQYRDFNGIFDIGADSARIVRPYWKVKFNELTRPGHYGEYFIEFYDYMSSFAQAYPVDTRKKERMLDSLEKSFQTLCMAVGVEEEFGKFQKDQQRIYGD